MTKRMLIDALHPEETRVVIADENQIYDFDFVSTAKKQLKGNIYLAKITRVEPSLQAAFVEYGGGKQGFLPFSEIHTDYYQIPVSDRKKLLEEAAREIEDNSQENVSNTDETEQNSSENTETEGGNVSASDNENTVNDETNPDDQERPAYLVHGAIDISISEEMTPSANEMLDITESGFSSQSEIENVAATESSENGSGDNAQVSEENVASPEGEKEEVETLANDEEELRDKRKRNVFMRRYKIQEVIRRGQIVLMQVIKEERGNKGASLTTYLSLAGRYCVLMPNSPKDGGISRKIASAEDRKRLKAISTEFRLAEGMSVIIRTAGMDRTHAEIKRDFDYLVKLWNVIREDTLKSNAPALIYEESDIVKRAIRDQYSNDIDEIVIEGESAYKSAREFMKLLLPSHLPKIKKYSAQTPLFYSYNIEEQLLSMHDPVVKMKSGAYLVINPTEALISIDVNSGRATGERNIEETALKTNLEAASEVARQLRLRDLAGLVVIDFIDMLDSRNRRAVEKTLKDAMKTDRAKIQLGRISPFGLLEMSRQRLRSSLSETNMMQCPHCIGRGVIRSHESMGIQAIRAIEKEASSGNITSLRVMAQQALAMHMLNYKRTALQELEKRYGISIQILINPEFAASEFVVEKVRRNANDRAESNEFRRPKRPERPERNERPRNIEAQAGDSVDSNVVDAAASEVDDDKENNKAVENAGNELRRSRRRGRRNRNNSDRGDNQERVASDYPDSTPQVDGENISEEKVADGEETSPKRQRERGGRGRRKWRDRSERNGATEQKEGEAVPTSWKGGAAELVDGKALPAFASDMRPAATPAPPTYKAFHDYKTTELETQSSNTSPPPQPKRGWWQKMISLDE
ncbi:MAG: Rne/Rng family ribonuclease [Pseudomonadota bacterium]